MATEVTADATADTLAKRLQRQTRSEHLRLHALMDRLQPFASLDRYGHFVGAQYLFQRDIANLLNDPQLRDHLPELAQRGHALAALADLQDLQRAVPDAELATQGVRYPEALGWLYVSEGSTLGAALLLKQVEQSLGLSAAHGARNLAAYPEGRAAAWRRFTDVLNGSALSPLEQDRVVAGALQAFARFGSLLERQFA